jgi:iron(III) transport system substrate-binding protein
MTRTTLAIAAAFAILIGKTAAAQSVAEIAAYAGPDRQAKLEAGAAKEGSVQISTVGTQSEPLFKRLREKYPAVKFEIYRSPTTDATRQIMEEYKAGRYVVDVMDVTTGGLQVMRDAGILQPYQTPEMVAYPKEAIEAKKYWVFDYQAYHGFGFNTKLLSPADAPKTFDDLLDPRWKGKMALSDNGGRLADWIGVLSVTRGLDFVRSLGKQDFTVYNVSGRALANLVVSGEAAMSPTITNSHVKNSVAQGATVQWRALGPVLANVNALALAAKAPHPNAAMLYIDFILSKEGQDIRTKIGDDSARLDLASADKPKEILYLSERPDYPTEFEKWVVIGRQVFGKGREMPPEKK